MLPLGREQIEICDYYKSNTKLYTYSTTQIENLPSMVFTGCGGTGTVALARLGAASFTFFSDLVLDTFACFSIMEGGCTNSI